MGVQELLEAARPETQPSRFQQLLDRARQRPLETFDFEISIGDVTGTIEFTEVRGAEWLDVAREFPRIGNADDARLGANTDAVIHGYPVDRIAVDGEHPTTDEWHKLTALIDAPTRSDIVTALWWLHVGKPQQNREALRQMRGETHGN